MNIRTLALIQSDKKSLILGGIFVVLNLIDASLTRALLANGGMEGNPITRAYGANVLVKGLLSLVLAAILVRYRFRVGLWVACGAMIAVVIWNTWLLFFLKNMTFSIMSIEYP
jgi:hypothetical protein